VGQKLSAASAHRRGTDLSEFFEQRQDFRFEFQIVCGEIGEALHGVRFYDAAAVFQVVEEDVNSDDALARSEREAREDLRHVPTDFDLISTAGETEELEFVRREPFGAPARDFFDGVRRTHKQDGVARGSVVVFVVDLSETGEKRWEFLRRG